MGEMKAEPLPASRAPSALLQRKCACGGTTGPTGECAGCRKKRLQRRALAGAAGPATAPPIVHDVLRSSGRPLDSGVRAALEQRTAFSFSRVAVFPQARLEVGAPDDAHEREADRFAEAVVRPPSRNDAGRAPGLDLSRVRLHTGAEADAAARSVHARAFTVGEHVVFGRGEYAPRSDAGLRLLAHELAHVGQQTGGGGGVVQRSIRIVDPAAAPVNPPPGAAPELTNAGLVEGWLDTLCPDGGWTVDAGTGDVSSPDRDTFCARRAVRGHAHVRSTAFRTSCDCLCGLTEPAAPEIRIHAADSLVAGGAVQYLEDTGEGLTHHSGGSFDVGISGKEGMDVEGAGDTAPLSGDNPRQMLRNPPWLIFGHEVCGHVRLWSNQTRLRYHSQTPEGDRETGDIENRIRREHSTITDNLGIRRDQFRDSYGAPHDGSVYRVSAGETLSGIARRCGRSQEQILTRVFRENGDRVTAADQNRVHAGERLMIQGIQWHQVIIGETMTSIAQMWDVPLASLMRANPRIPARILPGQRLLVPAS